MSANENVEELLKKLPGIQVDKDGKIKAMGESVQKVLVDGEEFFVDLLFYHLKLRCYVVIDLKMTDFKP